MRVATPAAVFPQEQCNEAGPGHLDVDIQSAVWLVINQAGSSGLWFQQLAAETELAWNIVLRALLFHYTNRDIQCLLEAEVHP